MRRPRLLETTVAGGLVAVNAFGNLFAFFGVFLALWLGTTGQPALAGWLFQSGPKASEFGLTTAGAVLLVAGSVLMAGLLVFGKWRLLYRPLHPHGTIVQFALSQKFFLLPYLAGAVFHMTLYQTQEANFFSFITTSALILLGLLQAVFFMSQTALWGIRHWRRAALEHAPMPLEDRLEPQFLRRDASGVKDHVAD